MSPEEDEKIKAFVNTPALDWSQFHGGNKVVHHHHRSQFTWVRKSTSTLPSKELPPLGYVCKRCGIQGHYVQYCPTNGDPNYDIKKVISVKSPTPTPDEAAFEANIGSALKKKKKLECAINVSPCTLCKKAMKDAVMMSRCCLESFCDKCIRDYLMNSKMRCVCGASGVLTNYLVPNMAVRGLINRILLESEYGEEELSRVAKKARTGDHVNKDFRVFHSLASHVY